MPHTITNLPQFKVVEVPIEDSSTTWLNAYPVKQGVRVGSNGRVNLPINLQISDTSTYEHCPAFDIDEDRLINPYLISAIGPDLNGEYILIDGSRTVEKKTNNCETHVIEVQSSVGGTGPKGEKGNCGGEAGQKGEEGDPATGEGSKGEPGEKGVKGLKGNPGAKGGIGDIGDKGLQGPIGDGGPKGSKGDQGPPGNLGPKGVEGDMGDQGPKGGEGIKGAKGDIVDFNGPPQESIKIAGETFGPRLIGVCQNGTYKYVYIFASDPT